MASTLSASSAAQHRSIRSSGKPHSCAECRRLKLRCDRVFPCESCRKRNVAALCPNGSLPPRPRLLAEDAVKLSKTIAELTNRCRQLEEALRTVHSKHYNEPHPLLDNNILTLPRVDAVHPTNGNGNGNGTHVEEGDEELEAVQDSLGTLTIDQMGNSNFLGRTAGMHMLLQSDDPEITDLLPKEIHDLASESLPTRVIFSNLANRKYAVMDHMRKYLPPSEKAWSLCEIYFEHAAWLVHPVARDHFIAEIFGPIYSNAKSCGSPDPPRHARKPDSHELALLFMVFSLATLLDLTLPPNNVEAEFYHQLARAGLSCEPILVEPTVPAIQTLILMSFYHWLGNRKHSEQISWGIMGLTVNLSQNVGLHRDSDAWRLLDTKIIERQRLLFWELYALELTEALNFGRPPSLSLSTIDCKMPADSTQFAFSNDELSPPFHSVKYRFFSIYLAPVIDAILGAKTVPYSQVLVLDKRVRDQDVAPLIEFDRKAPGDPIVDLTGSSMGVTMQKFMIVAWPHLTLLYLHRGYFVRALSEHQPGQSLLENRYAPSVLAIFRTSCVIIAMLQALERVNGDLAKRFWLYWCHGLAAAIVVGSIVAKAPENPLAQPALDQVNAAYALFERAAAQYPEPVGRPAKALTVVTRLRYRAHQAFERYHSSGKHHHPNAHNPGDLSEESETHDDELQIFGGHTRIVAGRTPQGSTGPGPATGQSPASSGSPEATFANNVGGGPSGNRASPKTPGIRGFTPETLDKAHPSLLAELNQAKEMAKRQAQQAQRQEDASATYHHRMAVVMAGPSTTYASEYAAQGNGVGVGMGVGGGSPTNRHMVAQGQPSTPLNTQASPTQWNGAGGSGAQGYATGGGGHHGHGGAGPGPATAYLPQHPVPAPSDTQTFGMLGGDPDWDNQWHQFMDQLGMYSADPNVPYPHSHPQMHPQHHVNAAPQHPHGHHPMHMQPKMER